MFSNFQFKFCLFGFLNKNFAKVKLAKAFKIKIFSRNSNHNKIFSIFLGSFSPSSVNS